MSGKLAAERGFAMHVIATAGHVDHGKSTLVRALTGMEPDRWAEERIERLSEIAGELIGSGVDILVTAGTLATLAARTATASTPQRQNVRRMG